MKVIIIFVSILFSKNTYSQDWQFCGGNESFNTYINPNYQIEEFSGYRKVWEKTVHIKKFIHKSKNVHISMRLYHYDCNRKMSRLVQLIYYDNKDNVIASYFFDYGVELKDVVPGTIGESSLECACNNYEKSLDEVAKEAEKARKEAEKILNNRE